MSVEFYKGSPGKFDSGTLSRKTLCRWTGRMHERGPVQLGLRPGTTRLAAQWTRHAAAPAAPAQAF